MHYASVIRDNQLSAELLRAYNGADVTLCDHGRLCANVDIRARRYGERGQYLPVAPR
jgi:antitoxin (DNA-binding transcriptional repressor) of toxin-antitoxin stability system